MLAAGDEPPDRPQIDDHLEWVWRAWHTLDADRDWFGGGFSAPEPRRLRWSAIRDWCEFYGRPGPDVDRLFGLIRAMDSTFFAWRARHKAE